MTDMASNPPFPKLGFSSDLETLSRNRELELKETFKDTDELEVVSFYRDLYDNAAENPMTLNLMTDSQLEKWDNMLEKFKARGIEDSLLQDYLANQGLKALLELPSLDLLQFKDTITFGPLRLEPIRDEKSSQIIGLGGTVLGRETYENGVRKPLVDFPTKVSDTVAPPMGGSVTQKGRGNKASEGGSPKPKNRWFQILVIGGVSVIFVVNQFGAVVKSYFSGDSVENNPNVGQINNNQENQNPQDNNDTITLSPTNTQVFMTPTAFIGTPTKQITPTEDEGTPTPPEPPKMYKNFIGLDGNEIKIAVQPDVRLDLKEGYYVKDSEGKKQPYVDVLALDSAEEASKYILQVSGISMTMDEISAFAAQSPEAFRESSRGVTEIDFSKAITQMTYADYDVKMPDGSISKVAIWFYTFRVSVDGVEKEFLMAGFQNNAKKSVALMISVPELGTASQVMSDFQNKLAGN